MQRWMVPLCALALGLLFRPTRRLLAALGKAALLMGAFVLLSHFLYPLGVGPGVNGWSLAAVGLLGLSGLALLYLLPLWL